MKTIRLSQERAAVVSEEDHAGLSAHRWHAIRRGRCFYAMRRECGPDGRSRNIWMHRAVLGVVAGPPEGYCVDHINGDGLDNRRSNLRLVTHSQNACNRRHSAGPPWTPRVGVKVTGSEKAVLSELRDLLGHPTMSAAIRFVMFEKARELGVTPKTAYRAKKAGHR